MKKVLNFLKVITVLNLAVFIPVYAIGLLMNQADLFWFMNEFKALQSGQIQLVAVILLLIEVMFTGVVLKGEKIIEM